MAIYIFKKEKRSPSKFINKLLIKKKELKFRVYNP